MKILMVTGTMPPAKCGVGDYTDRLIKALVNNQLDVDVLTDKEYNSKVGGLAIEKWKGSGFYNSVTSYVNRGGFNIVHIQYPTIAYKRNIGINLLPLWIKKYTKAKLVFTTHEYYQSSRLGKWRQWLNIRCSDAIITVDQQSYDLIKKNDRVIKCIPISSNIEKSIGLNSDQIRDSLLKGRSATKLMVHFGFIHEDRQFLSILKALYKLKKVNRLKTCLLVVGELKNDNNYHLLIKEYMDANQLKDDVVYTGYLTSDLVADHINAADFGIALFKKGLTIRHGSYLALKQEGLFIISSYASGSEDFTNTIFTFSETDKIAEAIETLQSSSTVKSLDTIKSWDEIAKEHKNVYQSIIES